MPKGGQDIETGPWCVQGQLATQVSHMKAGAQQVLDSLCGIYLRKPDKVANLARHLLGGQILVEAAFVALPRAHGMKVRASPVAVDDPQHL